MCRIASVSTPLASRLAWLSLLILLQRSHKAQRNVQKFAAAFTAATLPLRTLRFGPRTINTCV